MRPTAAVPYIETISPEDATGPLAELYERFADAQGNVAHILQIESLDPKAMKAHFELYRALMFGRNPLRRDQRELIAVVVSYDNRCHY